MKRNHFKRLWIILLIAGVLGILFYRPAKSGELRLLTDNLDEAVRKVYSSGVTQQVEFTLPDAQSIVLLSPPYANLNDSKISPDILKKIQDDVNRIETGHIFLISKDKIADHQLLSSSAEPIWGISQPGGDIVVFLVSKQETSGRPVRIELKK